MFLNANHVLLFRSSLSCTIICCINRFTMHEEHQVSWTYCKLHIEVNLLLQHMQTTIIQTSTGSTSEFLLSFRLSTRELRMCLLFLPMHLNSSRITFIFGEKNSNLNRIRTLILHVRIFLLKSKMVISQCTNYKVLSTYQFLKHLNYLN